MTEWSDDSWARGHSADVLLFLPTLPILLRPFIEQALSCCGDGQQCKALS